MRRNGIVCILAFIMIFCLSMPVLAEEALPVTSESTVEACSSAESVSAETPQPAPTPEQPEPTPKESVTTPESVAPTAMPPETTTPPATPTPLPVLEPAAKLEVDTRHVYEGMSQAYEAGYVPKIQDGVVQIVLPLKSFGAIKEKQIKVALDLGSGQTPFVGANYEKIFPLENIVPQNSGEEQQLYLVSFGVKLSPERINGTYPVTARVSAYDENEQPVSLTYTVFVTITDGASGEPEIPEEPKPEKPTAEPVVFISAAKMEPEIAMAGESFTLTLTLKNSLTTKSVENLLVTVDPGNLQINLLEDSNVIPVRRIAAGGSANLVLHFNTDPSISAEKHKINFHFQYNSNKTLGLSAEGSYVLDVRQSAKLDFDGATLPVKVFQEETVTSGVNLMNTGKSPLYNCRIDYAVDGLSSGGTTFLGEIPAGESKTGNTNLRVSSDQLGDVAGTITITYEDAFGQEYTKTADVSTHIAEKKVLETAEQKKPEKKDKHWWIFVLIGLAAGGGLGFGIPWYLRDQKQRKEDNLRL